MRKLGAAYRAANRQHPLFDTLGHHPHPARPGERPWKRHADPAQMRQGDWGRLVEGVREAFAGTAQRVAGQGLPIWYLETSYQTTPDENKRFAYTGSEIPWLAPLVLPDFAGGEPDSPSPSEDSNAPDQATQLVDSIRLAYCQPYVEAYFNFLLRDEPELSAYQSGVLWADGTPKDSYASFKRVIAEVNSRTVDCSRLKGTAPPQPTLAGGAASASTSPSASTPAAASVAAPPRSTGPETGGPVETRIAYIGTRVAAFGFVRLSAKLTRSASAAPVAGRRITFRVGSATYGATTNANGIATGRMGLPLALGSRPVTVSFQGDGDFTASSTHVPLVVENSVGEVTTGGTVERGAYGTARFAVRFDGRAVRGSLTFRTAGGRLYRVTRLTALGLAPGGRSAWFAGVARSGERVLAYLVDDPASGRADVVRLWVNGRPVRGRGWVTRGDVRIQRPSP